MEISILAPTRGATMEAWGSWADKDISILAPTRGATAEGNGGSRRPTHFNPRSHEGSDGVSVGYRVDSWISILAPTRGATLVAYRNAIRNLISILAPTRGATAKSDKDPSLLLARILFIYPYCTK